MRNRELKRAIDQAKRAQLKEAGGWQAAEAAELETRWELAGFTKKQRARWLQRAGLSYRQIGAVMGVSHAVVCKWLNPSYAKKQREWFERNQAAHAARVRAWYQANREEILKRRRIAYAARKAAA